METNIKVGDIMTRNFISANPETNLAECAKIMAKKRVGSLILHEKGKIKGILTEKDIVWALTKKSIKDLKKVKAKDIATKKARTIKPHEDINRALRYMNQHKVRRLPVVIKNNVVGMLTIRDILKVRPSLFEAVNELTAIREQSAKLKRSFIVSSKEGICEECGNYDMLYRIDNRLICEGCKDAM